MPPCKIVCPLEKCVGHNLKLLGMVQKIWTPLRKLFAPLSVPSWLRACLRNTECTRTRFWIAVASQMKVIRNIKACSGLSGPFLRAGHRPPPSINLAFCKLDLNVDNIPWTIRWNRFLRQGPQHVHFLAISAIFSHLFKRKKNADRQNANFVALSQSKTESFENKMFNPYNLQSTCSPGHCPRV